MLVALCTDWYIQDNVSANGCRTLPGQDRPGCCETIVFDTGHDDAGPEDV